MRLVFPIIFVFFAQSVAWGCTCTQTDREESVRLIQNASMAFYGEVIEVKKVNSTNTAGAGTVIATDYKFKVIRTWKGVDTSTVVVRVWENNCWWDFQVGETRIVLANDNPPQTSACLVYASKWDLVTETLGPGILFTEKPKPPESFFWRVLKWIFPFFF
jgi:hypothetical protein